METNVTRFLIGCAVKRPLEYPILSVKNKFVKFPKCPRCQIRQIVGDPAGQSGTNMRRWNSERISFPDIGRGSTFDLTAVTADNLSLLPSFCWANYHNCTRELGDVR